MIRIEFYGVPVSDNGVRQLALLLQHQAKIIVTRRIIRPQLDLSTNEPLSTRQIALLCRYDGKVAVSGGVGVTIMVTAVADSGMYFETFTSIGVGSTGASGGSSACASCTKAGGGCMSIV